MDLEQKRKYGIIFLFVGLLCSQILIIPQIVRLISQTESRMIEEDYLLHADLIVAKDQQLILRNGIISFDSINISIMVYGRLTVINATIDGKIKAFDNALVQIINSTHTVAELDVYNSAKAIIINSTVNKLRAYNSSKIIIDGVLYEAWMITPILEENQPSHDNQAINMTQQFNWKISECARSSLSMEFCASFSTGCNILFFIFAFQTYCIPSSGYNLSYQQTANQINITGLLSNIALCHCIYNVTGYLSGIPSGSYTINIFEEFVYNNERTLKGTYHVWV